MNRKKITSTDVARKAGVSQSAVSMILNKKYNVSFSRETIERVEEAARTLGYTNEKKASRTRVSMRGTIFVMCPNLSIRIIVLFYRELKRQHRKIGMTCFYVIPGGIIKQRRST